MTFSKAWLEKKIMCGLCNFGCCNHPSFHVEITEEEQEFYQKEYGLDLELEWLQDGCCKLLKDDNTWVLMDTSGDKGKVLFKISDAVDYIKYYENRHDDISSSKTFIIVMPELFNPLYDKIKSIIACWSSERSVGICDSKFFSIRTGYANRKNMPISPR